MSWVILLGFVVIDVVVWFFFKKFAVRKKDPPALRSYLTFSGRAPWFFDEDVAGNSLQGTKLFHALVSSLEKAGWKVEPSTLASAHSALVETGQSHFRVSLGYLGDHTREWLVTTDKPLRAGPSSPEDRVETRRLLAALAEFTSSTDGIAEVQWHKREAHRRSDYSTAAQRPFGTAEEV